MSNPARTSEAIDDTTWMAVAVETAGAARRRVSPRPWVGAVVVAPDGQIFRGATDGRTGRHAEVIALETAGRAAEGATIYATLEPCAHHGVTPPCADAVIAAGVRRVVVAVVDPDRKVAGEGIARMRDAGIEVVVGVGAAEVERQLAPYLHHRRTGRPYVVLKLAATLDGRTAAADGSSQWITGPAARLDAHRLRADSDAILVGAGTVRADDPALTVRLPAGEFDGPDHRQPLRVVLGHAAEGSKIHPCLEWDGSIDDLLQELGDREVLQLMVEGGATVAHAFHNGGFVNRYVVYLAPALAGGDDAVPLMRGPGASTIAEMWRGRIDRVTPLGDDLRIEVVPAEGGI